MAPSPATEAKAARLRSEGAVRELRGARVYAVDAASSGAVAYVVVEHAGGWLCTCPARGACSHLLAAREDQPATEEEVR